MDTWHLLRERTFKAKSRFFGHVALPRPVSYLIQTLIRGDNVLAVHVSLSGSCTFGQGKSLVKTQEHYVANNL
ncbi:hypothetical protein VNO78_25059 [Psophocarpus tetragonolobus]|uniref:Uncharacterized protein n=1 Tax=Psophocarpus tetragonolobus TaxID=3891 RepID=A0AAN9S667_PSOTE